MSKRTVFLVDDDEAIRHSASFMLRHAGFLVKTFPDGMSFLEDVSADHEGCILLDVRMPGMDGLAVQSALNQRGITMPIIILTGHGDVPVAVEAMKGGAIEFLEKPYEKQTLVAAIESAFEQLDTRAADERRSKEAEAKLIALTPREKEVLECLVSGLTNKGIAQALSISPRTVEIHRAHMMEKLEADSLSAALRIAFLAGLNTA
ncbi:MAG: response regulator [Pseudomonadota bacterium]|jgi:two-component system response regulator FixJ|nr:response regulator [Pseudomonadota bacterium]